MAHPNEELVRKGFEAFSRGDMDALRELFAPDIVWHSPGRSPLAGDFKGIDEVLGNFAKTMELTGGTFKVEVHDVLANDEHAVALFRTSAERSGTQWSDNSVLVQHIQDGKVTESWLHPGDQYAGDEFLSG
jgi:ketosteroid isomerase-like protein